MYIRLSFRTMFKDPVMLVPYAVYYAILNIVLTLYFANLNIEQLIKFHKVKLILAAGGFTLIEAFVLGITLSAIRFVVEAKDISKSDFLKRSFFIGGHTFLGTAAMVPVAALVFLLIKPFLGMAGVFKLLGIGVAVMCGGLGMMFKLFFPAAIAVDQKGFLAAFKQTFLMLKRNFVLSVAISLGLFSFWMMFLILAEIFGKIPVVGLSVFNVLIQSVAAIIVAAVPFFYYSFITLAPLKIMWHNQDSDEDGKSSL